MNIIKYRLLVKAIELGNLTKAASELGYTQSGASHQIKSVEEELGIKILQRDRSGTCLLYTSQQVPDVSRLMHEPYLLYNRFPTPLGHKIQEP